MTKMLIYLTSMVSALGAEKIKQAEREAMRKAIVAKAKLSKKGADE